MIFGNDRIQLRKFYFDSWKKFIEDAPLTDLEKQISAVIAIHPEYHGIFSDDENNVVDKDFANVPGDENPFLHLGLHLGFREQLSTDRPAGIKALFEKLILKYPDHHQLEHLCMELLAQSIWEAQKNSNLPDEKAYLQKLKLLLNK